MDEKQFVENPGWRLEPNVRGLVYVLRALDFDTGWSCEGHMEAARISFASGDHPWVSFFRLAGEKLDELNRIVNQYNSEADVPWLVTYEWKEKKEGPDLWVRQSERQAGWYVELETVPKAYSQEELEKLQASVDKFAQHLYASYYVPLRGNKRK